MSLGIIPYSTYNQFALGQFTGAHCVYCYLYTHVHQQGIVPLLCHNAPKYKLLLS